MLSRLLKEHQTKQNERKELQGMCFYICLPTSFGPLVQLKCNCLFYSYVFKKI